MGPLLEIWVDGEAVITLLSKCLNVTASIVYFSVSCKTLADGSFSFPIKSVSACVCRHMHVCTVFLKVCIFSPQPTVTQFYFFAGQQRLA